jgi:hypothetical protein
VIRIRDNLVRILEAVPTLNGSGYIKGSKADLDNIILILYFTQHAGALRMVPVLKTLTFLALFLWEICYIFESNYLDNIK